MILLYGAGGHAKVVIEGIQALGQQVKAIFDDNPEIAILSEIPVLCPYDAHLFPDLPLIITIGNNQIRQQKTQLITHSYTHLIHPQAWVSPSAEVELGSVILTRALVQAQAKIGKQVILNTGAIVEHECVIQDFVHVAPGAVICGQAKVGAMTLIGANATVLPQVKIGKNCVVGAGAVVTRDIPDDSKALGVPARISPLK